MKTRLLAAFLLALPSMAFAQLRPPATLYDQFFQLPEAVRPEAYRTLSAIERARLHQDQAARWRDLHRGHLSEERLALIAEFIARSTETRFSVTRWDEVGEFAALLVRLRQHFDGEDMRDAFSPMGRYIPRREVPQP